MSLLLNYDDFFINERKQILIAQNTFEKKLIKIEIVKNSNKLNDIKAEFEIMKKLNERNCVSCPEVYGLHEITSKEILEHELIDQEIKSQISNSAKESFFCIEQEYIPDDGDFNLSDIFLSILEQKSLGVYQADIKPANIRFDASRLVAYIIDYDQGFLLSDDEKDKNIIDFISFCDDYDKKKHGFGDFFRHFKQLDRSILNEVLPQGRLDLANTSLMSRQNTTNTTNGIYHTIDEKYFFAKGSRDVKKRGSILDQIEFKKGEKVLDVGCNNGLLCEYLYERGCKTSGIDNDPHIITLSRIMTNIKEKSINYRCVDIDNAERIGNYDTIMLFSVFHHTRKQKENAIKIAKSCNRFIIECRLNENGTQPIGPNGEWTQVSAWRFNSLEEMINVFEIAFEGFVFARSLGEGTKGRHILEFQKK